MGSEMCIRDSSKAELASIESEHAERLAQHRAREASLEEMLRELSNALRAEILRADAATARATISEARLAEAHALLATKDVELHVRDAEIGELRRVAAAGSTAYDYSPQRHTIAEVQHNAHFTSAPLSSPQPPASPSRSHLSQHSPPSHAGPSASAPPSQPVRQPAPQPAPQSPWSPQHADHPPHKHPHAPAQPPPTTRPEAASPPAQSALQASTSPIGGASAHQLAPSTAGLVGACLTTPRGAPLAPGSAKAPGSASNTTRYVERLMARANHGKVTEADVQEALVHFEAARRANDVRDFQTACTEFEAAYLLNPKPATLVSTANMYVKMGNASIAAEIYDRLLAERLPPHMHDFITDKLAQIQDG